jgi:6-pyruvoyltetrahydropterin/6-carboxytetrahydropterin synthase
LLSSRLLRQKLIEVPAVSESFHVRIAKAEHVFCAAHFITIGDHCERLHGHNYHVAAEVQGPLDENKLVVDFLWLRTKLAALAAELDHFVLLPTEHPSLCVEEQAGEVTATLGDRRWVFPRGDCRLLPLANTTVELLAAYLGRRLGESLVESGVRLERLRLELDECDGQIAVWER